MQQNDDLQSHQDIIDQRIKEGIDRLIVAGDIKEEDFFLNADGDKMIAINDETGDTIIFNYTQQRLYSYAGRLRS